MPKFEVFIPSASADLPNFTFRVEAPNWIGALKTGMGKLGEQGTAVQNLLVDVRSDNSVHITDPQSRRVFQIREMSSGEAAGAGAAKPVSATTAIGRATSKAPAAKSPVDLLSEVFESVQDLHKKGSWEKVFDFLLDLALEKIPAEAGTVFRADARTGELTFAAVRGPKARQLLDAKMVIPAGTGIAGFCALEGVSVALSEVEKDPRYYAAVAQRTGYPTRSILCSPMMVGGRSFGCLQIINKKEGSTFSDSELNLLAYIAHQGALYLQSR